MRRAILILFVSACAGIVLRTAAQEPPATAQALLSPSEVREDSLAHRLAWAMLTHDRSIRTLRWEQTNILTPASRPPFRLESTHAIDDLGRWSFDEHSFKDNPDRPNTQRSFRYNGEVLDGWGGRPNHHVLSAPRGQRFTTTGVDTFLGRWLDRIGQRRLGEMLLAASDLEHTRDKITGNPVLQATVALDPLVALLEVEIDPAHDFAPSRIWVRDRALRVAYYTYEIVEWVRVDDIWLPARAKHSTRRLVPMGELGVVFGKNLEAEGIGHPADFSDPQVQRAYERVLQKTFGAVEAPSEPMSPPQELSFRYIAVNDELPEQTFAPAFAAEDAVFDGLRNRARAPGGTTWVPVNRPKEPQ